MKNVTSLAELAGQNVVGADGIPIRVPQKAAAPEPAAPESKREAAPPSNDALASAFNKMADALNALASKADASNVSHVSLIAGMHKDFAKTVSEAMPQAHAPARAPKQWRFSVSHSSQGRITDIIAKPEY